MSKEKTEDYIKWITEYIYMLHILSDKHINPDKYKGNLSISENNNDGRLSIL